MEKGPSYDGSGLVNLIAEVEIRMLGESPSPGLSSRDLVPNADTYVLVMFDGLGTAQLEHQDAAIFRSCAVGTLEAPFATTTSVSLATIATSLPPSRHGQVAHLGWFPDLDRVVNTLKWVTINGESVAYDYASVLPRPNLWERLREGDVEAITVQPGDFSGSPLSRVTYRGARFEGAWDSEDLADATISLASEPGRLIFAYVPFVDFAGHVNGQGSEEFADAVKAASDIWERIAAGLPPDVALLGTADHGLMEVSEEDKILIRDPAFDGLRFAGDARGVHLWGEDSVMADLADTTGGTLVDPRGLIGPDPSDAALSHLGERLLLAPPGKVILPRGFDKRLQCYHGGLMQEELEIPILVG